MGVAPGPAAGPGKWSSGLYSCCDDGYVCCVGWQMTAFLFGDNYRKIMGGDSCTGGCCAYYWLSCIYLCALTGAPTRKAIRNKYNLPEEPCNDCCVHCFCGPCAICQEAREMRIREGWQQWR